MCILRIDVDTAESFEIASVAPGKARSAKYDLFRLYFDQAFFGAYMEMLVAAQVGDSRGFRART